MSNKKIFSMILSGLLMFSYVGCETGEALPQYEKGKQLHISGWIAPPSDSVMGDDNPNFINQEQYNRIAEAGFTAIYAFYESGLDNTLNALDCAEAAGIKYYVRNSTLTSLTGTQEYMEQVIEGIVAPYKNKPAFAGFLVRDEPPVSMFEQYGNLHKAFKNVLPDKDFYMNMVQTYAPETHLQGHTYEEFIDKYIDVVQPKILSYDHYPLLEDYRGVKDIRADYLQNYEVVALAAKKNNIPYWSFIQSVGIENILRDPTEAEIRWQMYTSLAFGSKGIQYFCYWSPYDNAGEDFTNAMIDHEGNKTPMYDYVKNVNLEVKQFEHVYMDFTYEGVMPLPKDNSNLAFALLSNPLTEYEGITSATANEDTLLTVLKDSQGRDGYMIVNYTDPALGKTAQVDITFKNATKALAFIHGEENELSLKKGRLQLELAAGEGIFVIPV